MRLSELVIIYLAAAAPVGVVYFLSRRAHAPGRARVFARAAAAALAWPFALAALYAERRRPRRDFARTLSTDDVRPEEARAEAAKRDLLAALRRAEDLLEEARGAGDERARRVALAAREGVERYAGLALAVAGSDADAPPTERELELCRIAGRKGDDLLLAGRCFHRNNFTRLVAHRERARHELLHALAEVREAQADARGDGARAPSVATRAARLSEATLQVLARAVELFSAFDDRPAAARVARLLDAECARLRRLEQFADAAHVRAAEGELCPAPSKQSSLKTEPLAAPLTQTTPTHG